jgi:hypothetical protein
MFPKMVGLLDWLCLACLVSGCRTKCCILVGLAEIHDDFRDDRCRQICRKRKKNTDDQEAGETARFANCHTKADANGDEKAKLNYQELAEFALAALRLHRLDKADHGGEQSGSDRDQTNDLYYYPQGSVSFLFSEPSH